MFRLVADRLTAWHVRGQRALPWRDAPPGARDPYSVWVSEIMAQQTRLAVVVDYFNRWMARFPTLESLVRADQQEVLKLWEGLGYYSRARNLHRAAQILAREHAGKLPRTRRELLRLPGIGDYTAGAILSLAYGLPEPAIDGNVRRVLSRLWDIDDRIDSTPAQKKISSLARDLVEAGPQPAAVNEAVMELGALLCRPRNPLCRDCPLQSCCRAHARGVQDLRPVRAARKQTPHVDFAAAVIWQAAPGDSPFLIARRPNEGLLGGLWSLPSARCEPEDQDLQACLRRALCEKLDLAITVTGPLTTVQHAFTHFRMTLHAFHARIHRGTPRAVGYQEWRWTTLDEADRHAFSVPDRRITDALRAQAESPAST